MVTGIIINPGTGPVGGTPTVEQAKQNMVAFCKDCRADPKTIKRHAKKDYNNGAKMTGPLKGVIPDEPPGDGRFCFSMKKGKTTYDIQMPGLPLENVRYTGAADQNIWNFPRLYVDGNSWVWMFAVHQAGGPDNFGESRA